MFLGHIKIKIIIIFKALVFIPTNYVPHIVKFNKFTVSIDLED